MAYHRILIGWVEGEMQAGKGEQVALIKKAATILEAIPLDKSGTGFMQASMNLKSSIHIKSPKLRTSNMDLQFAFPRITSAPTQSTNLTDYSIENYTVAITPKFDPA
jgi:hypothetical protein